MAIPTLPAVFVSGTKAGVSTWLNAIRTAVLWLLTIQPKARVTFAGQTISSGTLTTLPMSGATTVYDRPGGMVGSGGITIQQRGWYKVQAHVGFASNAAGIRVLYLVRGGTVVMSLVEPAINGAGNEVDLSYGPILCEVGQVWTVQTLQTSGASLGMSAASYLSVSWDDIDA